MRLFWFTAKKLIRRQSKAAADPFKSDIHNRRNKNLFVPTDGKTRGYGFYGDQA